MIESKRCLKYFFKQTDIYNMSTDEIGQAVFQIKKGKNIAVQSVLAKNPDETENQVMDVEIFKNDEFTMNIKG